MTHEPRYIMTFRVANAKLKDAEFLAESEISSLEMHIVRVDSDVNDCGFRIHTKGGSVVYAYEVEPITLTKIAARTTKQRYAEQLSREARIV